MTDWVGKRVRIDRPLWEFAEAKVLAHNTEDRYCRLRVMTGSLAGQDVFLSDHQLVPLDDASNPVA